MRVDRLARKPPVQSARGVCTARHRIEHETNAEVGSAERSVDHRGWSVRSREVPDRLDTAAVRWLGPREVPLGMQAPGDDGGWWTSRSGSFSAGVAAVLRRGLG